MPDGDLTFGERWKRWVGGALGLAGPENIKKYQTFLDAGGTMSYEAWRAAGLPTGPGVTPYAQRILGEQLPEYYPEYAERVAEEPGVAVAAIGEAAEAARKAEAEAEEAITPPPFPTEAPPEGYVWQLNELNKWVPVYRGEEAPGVYTAPEMAREAPTDPYGRAATWNERLGEWDYPPDWGIDPAAQEAGYTAPPTTYQPFGEDPYGGGQWNPYTGQWEQPAGYIPPYQQEQLQLEQQRLQQESEYQAWQQEEAQRQYGAQLAAQPQSWLQYAAYTGEQPAIQPWMQPLMPQQYAELGAGAAIPGWGGDTTGMTQLPELTRPSRQYQARMGPTAMQQYYGYQQARTGARPEEQQWRLWSGAPPGGQYQGLRYTR